MVLLGVQEQGGPQEIVLGPSRSTIGWSSPKTQSWQRFSVVQIPARVQVYTSHNELRERRDPMENTMQTNTTKLVWAVLTKGANGRSEVIKVTTADEADRAVSEHPGVWYKSGPIVLA